MNRWIPAAVGLGAVALSVVAADLWAVRTRRPTISAAVAQLLEHPVGGPAVIAGLAALAWHLTGDPIVRRLEAR